MSEKTWTKESGLAANNVEDAIDQLAIDSVIGSKTHEGEEYRTLDYSRLVALLIPSVNHLSQQVRDLPSKVNGQLTLPRSALLRQ